MEGDRLFDVLGEVKDEPSFVHFVRLLIADRQSADGLSMTIDGLRGDWANHTVVDFLEAAAAWAEDSDFGDRPGPKPSNLWQLFALFLWAGRAYE